MTTISIDTGEGKMNAYVATPPGSTGPALVVIQEIFGVNKVMRDLADGFAAHGFVAICPDLFWRIEPGIDITDQTKAEWDRAFELFQAFDVEKGVHDIARTMVAARSHAGATAYAPGTRESASGDSRHKNREQLDEAFLIHKPLMLHIAGKDAFVPPAAQRKMHDALDGIPLVTLHDYPNDDHAFARHGGKHYDQASSDQANARSLGFFKQHLA